MLTDEVSPQTPRYNRVETNRKLQGLHPSTYMGRSREQHGESDRTKNKRIPKQPSDIHWKVQWTSGRAATDTEYEATIEKSGRARPVWDL